MQLLTCPICGSLRARPNEFSCRTQVPENPETPPVPSERCRALAYYRLAALRSLRRTARDYAPSTFGHGMGRRIDLLVPRVDGLGFDAVPAFVYPTGLIDVPGLATCGKDPEALWAARAEGRFICPVDSLSKEIIDILRAAS